MKIATSTILLCVLLSPRLLCQAQTAYDMNHMKEFQKQIQRDNVFNWISNDVAGSLLLQKSEPVMKSSATINHRMGTVVVALEIGRNGEVKHPTVVSGPKILQKPVLEAVRQYQYKPYQLNGAPIAVATTVSVTVANY
ncbi:MAG: energy transducer TonB [Terracidiphilus sp.]